MYKKPDERWISLCLGKVHIRFTVGGMPWDRYDFIPFSKVKKYKWQRGSCHGRCNTYTVTFCWLRTDLEIFFNKWTLWKIKIHKFWNLEEE